MVIKDDINAELESVSSKLDQSAALQSTFDRWAGNWLGGKKASAMKEAAAEIAIRSKEDHSKVKEVFQHEKYDSITRVWKASGLVLCTDTAISVDDLFDPALQEKLDKSSWLVDIISTYATGDVPESEALLYTDMTFYPKTPVNQPRLKKGKDPWEI